MPLPSAANPRAAYPPGRSQRLPTVDLAVCTACGVCVMVCPAGAVGIAFVDGRAWVPAFDGARCVGCFDCEMACPDGAIEVPFEIVEEEFVLP